ncbi:hypothetical protein TVAG_403440 [Trichomonas vaginalis G3]|uniref:F5/8 type C domain-containing protein n=1 Tax=Trichomonas vaginalis (strain ATCC PRA-98 / G3) TaxID=412133 RepID=A2F8Y0_TRIV3|nr:hypothetical protein TVAGG3_0688980 [Trichomonas vaginalis G3]EAX98662.1 hypothetical protein TVAG_403440 [Trichomonas vaginalis G3]KAI5508424.1 hypothetical protein TVAGG3_0688980 [Trichomonas vaginalis G3]|eukprot:XP_001311592.1 hypothetical protein [Trichomonas vaginalis G3]
MDFQPIARVSFNLENTNLNTFPHDFAFLIDDKRYECYLQQVLIVSGLIQKIYRQDNRIKEYRINSTKDPHHYFPLFMQLISGKLIHITFENSFFFKIIADELEIPSLANSAIENQKIQVNNENLCKILEIYDEYKCNYSNLIDYLAKNWSYFSNTAPMSKLPLHILQEILNSDNFNQTNEGPVIEWIHNLVLIRGPEFRSLYNTRPFEKLTSKQMSEVVIPDISYDYIDPQLWNSLTKRLILPLCTEEEENAEQNEEANPEEEAVEPNQASSQQSNQNDDISSQDNQSHSSQQQQPPAQQQQFQYMPQQTQQLQTPTLSQIIQSQQEAAEAEAAQQQQLQAQQAAAAQPKYPAGTKILEYQTNVIGTIVDEYPNELVGVVTYLKLQYPDSWKTLIYVTGGGNKCNRILQIFNFNDLFSSWWDTYSGNGFQKKDAWLTVKFNNHRLEMTGYTLGSCARNRNSHQPRVWKVEGSNDNETWFKVNEQKTNKMNMATPLVYFDMKKTKPYSYFRWTMIENNTTKSMTNQYEFSICALELFGILIPIR